MATAAEKGHAHGKRALSFLDFGKDATLNTYGLDNYGRTIADIVLLTVDR